MLPAVFLAHHNRTVVGLSTWHGLVFGCFLACMGTVVWASDKSVTFAAKPAVGSSQTALKPSGMISAIAASTAAPLATKTPPVPASDVSSDKRLNPRQSTRASVAASATTIPDPMDRLQERLTERLGARMVKAESKGGGELRLVARPVKDVAQQKEGGWVHAKSQSGGGTVATKARKAPADLAQIAAHIPWSYDGPSGPEHWGQLKAEYAACRKGERQSPIDLRDGIKVQLDAIEFNYQVPDFRVVDNGRTVRVNVSPGSSIEIMGRRYELTHLQFHRPSEVRVNGKSFDMSAHLMHRDAQGRIAIVAVLLERGSAHPVVQTVWNNLPLEKGVELVARAPLDLMSLLPADQRYATFMGSMTTPPCEEGVLWLVMKTPVSISNYQIAVFTRLYPMNARPLQPDYGRLVKESE